MDDLTIGQVAERADVHKETIRYYQGLGLLDEPRRRPRKETALLLVCDSPDRLRRSGHGRRPRSSGPPGAG